MSSQVFEQSIQIQASPTVVDYCITDQTLMHQWLNPALRCEPIGEWDTQVGSRSRFILQVPLLQPSLNCVISQREPGLIVWEFQGFFTGCDRWDCQKDGDQTRLLNRFEFEIPNPVVAWGFDWFAAPWTRKDMQAQLRRLKQIAEHIDPEIVKI
jgi:hypothetical protein